MNKKIIYYIIAIIFGVFMVAYGGYDDSPGGQLLGLILVVIGIIGTIKSRNKKFVSKRL